MIRRSRASDKRFCGCQLQSVHWVIDSHTAHLLVSFQDYGGIAQWTCKMVSACFLKLLATDSSFKDGSISHAVCICGLSLSSLLKPGFLKLWRATTQLRLTNTPDSFHVLNIKPFLRWNQVWWSSEPPTPGLWRQWTMMHLVQVWNNYNKE